MVSECRTNKAHAMILALFTLEAGKYLRRFEPFLSVTGERYGKVLASRFEPVDDLIWMATIKPIHGVIAPYLVLDLMITARQLPCHVLFANDVLDFRGKHEPLSPENDEVQRLASQSTQKHNITATTSYQGFGPRIDIALNAISLLYMEILLSLTQVEANVLSSLRAKQYERYQHPGETRTFGLQKHVAHELEKSPVAVHKSLRSAKYDLLASSAKSMSAIIG